MDQTYDIGRIEDVHWNPWYVGELSQIYVYYTKRNNIPMPLITVTVFLPHKCTNMCTQFLVELV